MAFMAPLIAAAGSMLATSGAAAGTAAAAAAGTSAAAAGGTAAAAAAGASALWGAGAAGAAGAGAAAAGAGAAAAGTAAAGLTAAEMAMLGMTAAGIGATMLTPTPKMALPFQDKPEAMPEADDDAIRKTRQRAMINQQQRGGRTSTMLSDSYDKLG